MARSKSVKKKGQNWNKIEYCSMIIWQEKNGQGGENERTTGKLDIGHSIRATQPISRGLMDFWLVRNDWRMHQKTRHSRWQRPDDMFVSNLLFLLC